jgi:hypothetical protein
MGMNITLIGSMNDNLSRLTYQWFVANDIQAEYVEVDAVPNEILEAGITSLPIVLLKGNYYCHGYDLRALELLPYR